MNIKINGNTYSFELGSYAKYSCYATNFIEAKEMYLKAISDQIDNQVSMAMKMYYESKNHETL